MPFLLRNQVSSKVTPRLVFHGRVYQEPIFWTGLFTTGFEAIKRRSSARLKISAKLINVRASLLAIQLKAKLDREQARSHKINN